MASTPNTDGTLLLPRYAEDALDHSDDAMNSAINTNSKSFGCDSAGDEISTCDQDNASVCASTNLLSSTTPDTEPVDSENFEDDEEAYYEFLREMGCEFTDEDIDESDGDVENEESDCCGSSAEVRTPEPVLENKSTTTSDMFLGAISPPAFDRIQVCGSPGIKSASMAPVAFAMGPSPWLLRAIKMAQEDATN
jgi:hypothetical protein